MQMGLYSAPVLVDLKRISELTDIDVASGVLRIGAAARHLDIAGSDAVRARAPMLVQACSELGNQRVRSSGSIGGNVCFADHRSDVLTALFALRAQVRLQSVRGMRTAPIDEFVVGAMDVVREPEELLLSIEIADTPADWIYVRHQPAEYPTVCIAITRPSADDEAVEVVVGAAVERPHRFTFASLDEVDPQHTGREIEAVEDLTGSEEYKQHLVSVFVGRAVAAMRTRSGLAKLN